MSPSFVSSLLTPIIWDSYALELIDSKASYFIAKELSIIQLNIMWHPEKLASHVDRLRSLSIHVKRAIEHTDAVELSAEILQVVDWIENNYKLTV